MNKKIHSLFIENFSSFSNLQEFHLFNYKLKEAVHSDAELLWKGIINADSYQEILEAISFSDS